MICDDLDSVESNCRIFFLIGPCEPIVLLLTINNMLLCDDFC